MTVRQRHLVIAPAITVLAGAGLATLAYLLLDDRGGTRLWLVGAVRAIVALVLSKAGLKVGLAVVLGAIAGATWIRKRRGDRAEPPVAAAPQPDALARR